MPDCGDNSCRYATAKTGMRTNGGCHCDRCPDCSRFINPKYGFKKHYSWCAQQEWIPEHLKIKNVE